MFKLFRPVPVFVDGAHEQAFLREYWSAALGVAIYASIAAAGIFAVFLALSFTYRAQAPIVLAGRLSMIVFLAGAAWLVYSCRELALRRYVWVTGTASFVTLLGTVLIGVASGGPNSPMTLTVAPAVVFGLFIHYAFLRLPLAASAAIGWSASIAALLFAPSLGDAHEAARSAVYFAFTNLAGMVACRALESRERGLFSQRIQLEEARSAARERAAAAEEANREKTRLIAAISHDLRQPMTAAMAYMDVLHTKLDATDVVGAKAQVGRVEAAINVLGATLDHLVQAARYDSGRETMEIVSVDVGAMLLDLRDSFAASASHSGVDLRLRLPRGSVFVQTDARSLHRVLTNLVSNAVKFSASNAGREGKVLITLRVRAGRCRIDVIDTGIGIAPENLEEVWKPFVQLNMVERDRAQGLGLGLFLVRRIIEQLPGHSIHMRSTPGRGTCATVLLPGMRVATEVVTVVPTAQLASILPEERVTLRGAFIVLIEDDQDARRSLSDLLESWGVLVAAGATLNQVIAAESLDDRTVDAIICDYRLPGRENGLESIVRLKGLLGYAPSAVLITGESDAERIAAQAPKDMTVLHKPFTPRALALPLIEAVARARLTETLADGDDTDDRTQPVQPGA